MYKLRIVQICLFENDYIANREKGIPFEDGHPCKGVPVREILDEHCYMEPDPEATPWIPDHIDEVCDGFDNDYEDEIDEGFDDEIPF